MRSDSVTALRVGRDFFLCCSGQLNPMQHTKEIHNCQAAYARCLLAFTGSVLQQVSSAVLFLVEKRTPIIFWKLELVTLQPGALAPVCYDLECNIF